MTTNLKKLCKEHKLNIVITASEIRVKVFKWLNPNPFDEGFKLFSFPVEHLENLESEVIVRMEKYEKMKQLSKEVFE